MAPSQKSSLSPVLVLFFGVVAISFSAIFVRFAQDEAVNSLVIAAWRTMLAALLLLPITLAHHRDDLAKMEGADWQLAFVSGFMLALHFASWISSLDYTSIAGSTVLVTTAPIWVALASPFFLKESLSRSLKIGIVLALLGSVIISLGEFVAMENGRFTLTLQSTDPNQNHLLGSGLALLGAITAAVYLLIGRRLRARLSLLSYTTVVYGTAALTLVIFVLLTRPTLFGYTPKIYLLFFLMALFPQLMGHTSFNWALGHFPAAYVSVAIISEPIGATILALLIFGEVPGPWTLAGGVLILAGVVQASRRQQPEPAVETVSPSTDSP